MKIKRFTIDVVYNDADIQDDEMTKRVQEAISECIENMTTMAKVVKEDVVYHDGTFSSLSEDKPTFQPLHQHPWEREIPITRSPYCCHTKEDLP